MAERPVDPEHQDIGDGSPDGMQDSDIAPGTQPADAMVDSSSQDRPVTTQAVFRPDFDDDDDFRTSPSPAWIPSRRIA